MLRIVKGMTPDDRAIVYVKNAIEVTGVDIYGHVSEYMYPITNYIESILPTVTDRRRNMLDNLAQIKQIIQFIKDDEEMDKWRGGKNNEHM